MVAHQARRMKQSPENEVGGAYFSEDLSSKALLKEGLLQQSFKPAF